MGERMSSGAEFVFSDVLIPVDLHTDFLVS
jgi:hypothetical protein